MVRIRKTALAERDLDDIWFHIASDNIAAADRLIDMINERAISMADHPSGGRARSELGPDIRSFAVGAYVVFYAPLPDGIRIARVLHGARDIDAAFHEDDSQPGPS